MSTSVRLDAPDFATPPCEYTLVHHILDHFYLARRPRPNPNPTITLSLTPTLTLALTPRARGRQVRPRCSAACFGGVFPKQNGRPKSQPRPIRQSGSGVCTWLAAPMFVQGGVAIRVYRTGCFLRHDIEQYEYCASTRADKRCILYFDMFFHVSTPPGFCLSVALVLQ